jgi:filamin
MPELKFENQDDGNVDVSYKVKQGGEYKIHVLYDNNEITDSPFDCIVSEDEEQYRKIISTIKCSGPNLTAGQCGVRNEIYIDCKEAEIIDSLDFQMEGPGKAEVSFIENKDGTLTVCYIPPKPGDYRLHLKYSDIHLPGSPFTITILD